MTEFNFINRPNQFKFIQDFVLLALCMEVLDEVLQQVHPLFDFDLVDFKEIL